MVRVHGEQGTEGRRERWGEGRERGGGGGKGVSGVQQTTQICTHCEGLKTERFI